MRTLKQKAEDLHPEQEYPLDKLAPLDKILFLDIETTGFTARSSSLYLIGCAYWQNGCWYIIQWFAASYEEEKDVLSAFFCFAADYTHLVHFNGNNFDLPYLSQKSAQYHLNYTFDNFTGIDLYRRAAGCKALLRLENCKQKTLEAFLHINRSDMFNGGELISVYHHYVKEPDDFGFQALVLHNADDMRGMLRLIPILSYADLVSQEIQVTKAQANYYSDQKGERQQELILKLKLFSPLPFPLSRSKNHCYFTGEKNRATLRIPILEGELKYFYSGYQDYYYLPAEDVALHKSVASFVDKAHRQKATAATCYTRKYGVYLPQWSLLFEPFFKKDYQSPELFFELTEEFKTNRKDFSLYAQHILEMIVDRH